MRGRRIPAGTATAPDFEAPTDSDADGIPDFRDQCPNSPAGSPVDSGGCPLLFGDSTSLVLPNVTFEFGSATLRASSNESLDEVAAALLRSPEIRMMVSGHTDNVGSKASHDRLSQSRADAVRQYLIEKGVPADRLVARGFGDTRPIATNETATGRARNRRVELSVIP